MIGTMNSIYGKSKSLWMVLAFSFVALSASAKDVFYVKSGANGDGSSWSKAFGNIQQAVDSAAKIGADVWVAKGVYQSESSAVVTLKPNVSLYGGFAGTETSLSARDTSKNPTVLDGDGKCRVIYQGDAFADAAAVVVDGFTIRNGYAAKGGGLYINGNVTVNNCIIRGNKATNECSAIYAEKSTFKNSQIVGNTFEGDMRYTMCLFNCVMDGCAVKNNTSYSLSAIYAIRGSSITNCEIEGNSSTSNSRGSYFEDTKVINCKFVNTSGNGSAVELSGPTVMRGCLFKGNKDVTLNIIYMMGNTASLEDCQIVDNSTTSSLLCYYGKINRCLIKGNTTSSQLVELYNSYSSISNSLICDNVCTSSYEPICLYGKASMRNCTFVRNSVRVGKIFRLNGAILTNSIIVGNKVNGSFDGVLLMSESDKITNNMLQNTSVEGNLNATMEHAAFTDPENGDYSLSATSYCINAGTDVADSLDFLGNPRKQGGAVDMGAIESSHTSAQTSTCGDIVYVKAGAKGNGSSWQSAFGDIQSAIFAASVDGKKHQIWVAAGTYYGDTTLNTALNLASGVSLYGGFAGNETSLAARDVAKNPTILDGQKRRRVLTQNAEFSQSMACVVDGFTIQNGFASNGGGIYINGNVTVNNCILRENKAYNMGSAIYAEKSTIKNSRIVDNSYEGTDLRYTVFLNRCVMDSCAVKNNTCNNVSAVGDDRGSTITNCEFEGNSSTSSHRGFYLADTKISNCKFVNTSGNGSAVELSNSSVMRGCLFKGNKDMSLNLIALSYSQVLVEDCQFIDNSTTSTLLSYYGKISRCLIKGNTTASHIVHLYYSYSSISNCLIYDNVCTTSDEPIHLYDRAAMRNCTVVRNRVNGGKIVRLNGSILNNSIIVGNTLNGSFDGILTATASDIISNNLLQSTFVDGNLNATMEHAAFTDPENGDYSLSANSFCINAGADVADSLDFFKKPRKQGGAVDMGAIESSHTVAPTITCGEILYVKAGAKGNGSSWQSPFGDIHTAMFAAADGKKHQIWVAAGTYYGDTTLNTVVNLASGVSLYGGFAGNETSLAARDTAKNPTILDGMGKRRVITQNYGFVDSMAVVVDGFTIRNGYAAKGGGVYINGNVTINNCILRENRAYNQGSAICADKSTIKNSRIVDNSYEGNNLRYTVFLNGCVMDSCVVKNNTCYNASAVGDDKGSTITNCEFEGNSSTSSSVGFALANTMVSNCKFMNTSGNGSVVDLSGSSVMRDCLFKGNRNVTKSLVRMQHSQVLVEDCQFIDNSTTSTLLNYYGKINRCLIKGNTTSSRIVELYYSYSSISNSLICDNVCTTSTEPIHLYDRATMRNCTVVRNSVTGAKVVSMNNAVLSNSIIVGNTLSVSSSEGILASNTSDVVTNNLLQNTFVTGNFNGTMEHAAFTDAENGDYSLSAKSYGINAGADVTDSLDFFKKPRKQGGAVDMGAIESPHTVAPAIKCGEIVYVKAGAKGDGSSWQSPFGDIQSAMFAASVDGKRHQIWVATGTYYGDTTLSSVVNLASGISLYGGFAGNETSLAARDTVKNPTILDGQGKRGVIAQNYRFVDSMAVVVDGFTIRNGYAQKGAGLYINENATINNCIIRGNKASKQGSAIYAYRSIIKNSQIVDNTCESNMRYTIYLYEGVMDSCAVKNNTCDNVCAIYGDRGSSISNCVLEGNRTSSDASTKGSYFYSANVSGCKFINTTGCGSSVELGMNAKMRNCLFEGNKNERRDLVYMSDKTALLEDCQILDNSTTSSLIDGNGKVNRCLIKGNRASYEMVDLSNSSSISNSLICDNASESSNGIVVVLYGNTSMSNCTVVRNSTQGGCVVSLNNATLMNSIIVGNQMGSIYGEFLRTYGTNNITNNMLEETFVDGNFDGSLEYAAFTDVENGDYSLSANSYCINAGKDVADTLDVFRNPRKQGGAVDMGAIESSHTKAPSFTCGDIVYVKEGATGNGSSWQSAFGNVQKAIVAASADGKKHQIWVAAGTYYGDTTLNMVVNLASGISLYGGFAGNETSLAARDTAKNPTILDGMGKRRVISQNYGFVDSMAVVVDGFTIQNGYATDGAGACLAQNTTMSNCIVKNCYAGDKGYVYSRNANLVNVVICDNGDMSFPSAIPRATLYMSGGTADNCVVKNNASYSNSALYAEKSAEITRSIFDGNQSSYGHIVSMSQSTMSDCKVINHDVRYNGGCIISADSKSNIERCLIEGNEANTHIMSLQGNSIVSNSLITGCNSRNNQLISAYGSQLINCTVVDNACGETTIYCNSNSQILNSIVVGNKRPANSMNIALGYGSTVKYSMIEGGADGEGNIDGTKASASFTDAVKGDYSLSATSLCINAGTDVADSLDLFGNARKQSDAVDMGAIESAFTERAPVGNIIYVKAGSNGSGVNWDDALGEINQAITLASTAGQKRQVWVAKGTYCGDTSLVSAISLAAGVSVYGGFDGTESSLEERDAAKNVTIIDGKYKRRCIIQNYDFADSLAIVVDGFTIQNGYLSGNDGVNAMTKKNTTFNNCIFRNARAGNDGVYAEKTTFKNCKFVDNIIREIRIIYGVIDSCVFMGDRTSRNNYIDISDTRMSHSQVSDYSVERNLICVSSNSVVSCCKIMNNESTRNIIRLSISTLENSLVYGNVVRNSGQNLISADYTSFITNSTIAHNTTRSNSAIGYSSTSSNHYATVANSIIYGNKVLDEIRPQVVVSDYIRVKYCASDGELTGENNIRLATSNSGSDPSKNYVCFINAAGGDYRLHATSACIDKGLDSLMKAETDLNGGARIYGKAIDLGAVEFDGEYVQMRDYSQPVCYNRYSLEATFDSTISKIDWEIIYAGNVSGFENISGSGTTIPAMQLRTSGSDIDTLILKVTPYNKAGVAGNPFNYKYFVYPDFSKKVVAITQPQVAYLVNEQNNTMSIDWKLLALPVEVDRYDLYVWKASQKVPANPMASFVKGHGKQLTGLDNHTTYKYMVKAVIACDTISSEIDSFRIDIPVSLTMSGNVNCVFGSKLNETSSLTRYVRGFELTDSITYTISGKDAADFSASFERGWDKLNGGDLRIYYTPTDVKKQTSDAEITIRSGNSGKYEITLYLAGTLSNYYVYAATVGQDVYQAGDTVDVVGILTDAYGTPMAGKTLTIEANSNTGVSHSTTDVTDSTGRAAVRFATSKTEFGTYSVNVYVGSKTNGDALAKFDIPGMSYTGGTVKWTIQLGDTIEGSITMTNRSNIPLHNLVVESRELAEGLVVEFDTLALLHGYETARIPFRATGTKLTEGRLYLPSVFRVSCDEKTTSDFSTYFYCEQPYGQIKAFPSNINEYVSKQKPKYINIELTNAGFGETGAVTLSLPDFGGFSVPNTTLPSIKSGDTARVSLRIAYFDGAPINVPFTGTIGVNCANGKSTSLPFRVEYSSESKGSLEVDVVDEYYYNTAEKRHLRDAKVVVRNQYNNAEVASGYTDTAGVVRFDSIPEGTYLLSVKADKHSEYQETIEIQAGQKSSRFIFLAYQAITYTWNVERVEIEDRYDISLDLEYETNVPAPVVTLTFPNGVPDKSRFEVGVPKTVRLQITNHGLIAARYVKFAMPKVPYYRFYVPYDYIDSLPANHTEFVPVTIVRTENEFASSYDISGGNGLLLENESFGTSECPSVHAEYSYVCGVLRLLSTVSETTFPCPSLKPVTHGGGQGGWGGVDVPPYGGGSHKDEHQFGKVENHQYSVNLDIPCNTCQSKIDPWKCAGDILGYIPIIGPLLNYGVDQFDDAMRKDHERRMKRLSCEQKDQVDSPYDWSSLIDADVPEDIAKSTESFTVGVETKTFGESLTDFKKFKASGGVLNYVGEFQKLDKAGQLLNDFFDEDPDKFDSYEAIDLVFEEGRDIFDAVAGETNIPIISAVPWDCLDLTCQVKSCEKGRYASSCGRYALDRLYHKNSEDEDTRKTVTTEGDTVVIVDGEIVDVLYPDGDSLSAQKRSEKSKDAAIAKAKYDMPSSIYQTSDARMLAAHDAVELAGFLQYRGNVMKELAGSGDLLSQNGILDYFDYTIKNYSRGEAIDIEAIRNLPTTGISTTDLVGMALRWNETLLANENGVYSPNEEYPNIVDKRVIDTYMDSIISFYTYLRLRGMGTVHGMMVSINEQVNKPSQKGVCATVKLHIAQTLTMTREAFDGTLTVNNGNESGAMEGFKVVLEVRDEKGNLSNDLFQINTEKLTGVSAIDGTGEIAPKSEGTALFRFIPEKGAAPTAPVNYSFGGHIIYVDPSSGDTVTAQLYPVTLTVNPCPDLQIDYFMQRNILGDDALTLDRVEPSVPAALGVRIDNQGYGDAKKVKLETAQPEIVDNEKGLLIDFAIIGSSLNGKDCDLGSENIDFGDIEAHTAKTGVWWMTSSLLGHFTKYEASVVHANSYGNPDLSLVKGIAIHELIKTVDAYGVKEDGVVDFLVNGKKDEEDTPDTIYYSNGGKDPVHVVQWVTLDKEKVKPTDTVVRLTATPSDAGWNYARVNDPGDNCYEIQKVVRVKDSVEIPLDNVWTTFVTLPDGQEPIYVNHLHFLDYMTTMGENDYDIYYSVKKNVLVVTEISGVPTSANAVLTPVESVVVKFNRKIQKETFDYKDIELFCQGGDNLSDSTITVTQRDDYTYVVDIASKTNASGFFKIEVNVNNVLDQNGYAGTFGKNATWSQLVEGGNPGGGDNPGGEDNPGELTPVADIADDKVLVYAYRDGIYVKSAKAGALDIYDILSRLVVKNARYGEGVTMVATLPKGIYIINGKKVIVK